MDLKDAKLGQAVKPLDDKHRSGRIAGFTERGYLTIETHYMVTYATRYSFDIAPEKVELDEEVNNALEQIAASEWVIAKLAEIRKAKGLRIESKEEHDRKEENARLREQISLIH